MSGSHHEKLLWFPGYSAAGHDINKQMCSGIPGLCVGGRQIDKQTCSVYGRQNTGKIQKE